MDTPVIPRPLHGVADYLYVPAVAAAPALFGFAHHHTPARLARLISGGVLASTMLTRAEWGVFKAMPYKAHLALDFGAGVGTMALPWLAGFSRRRQARNAFLIFGAISVGASLLSGLFGGAREMPATDDSTSDEPDGLMPPALAPVSA
ncbi:SPW repeat domain-containing protein [Hymenobacter properus]|uniref:SPW repeat-containing integral membrane domain-containing protein n=1 Tax=Hymenobacter properus TaxID=2791026 RepID=A0A931FHS8_9BACT|nr:hypothetical protein [Hymenobacter properus]MBF9140008.1 hypothetical protein [Hymenobacter properus]MBR7718815.1 hypothetical protein [Microvirga sp. SRT04]